jgi:hypothetical protein
MPPPAPPRAHRSFTHRGNTWHRMYVSMTRRRSASWLLRSLSRFSGCICGDLSRPHFGRAARRRAQRARAQTARLAMVTRRGARKRRKRNATVRRIFDPEACQARPGLRARTPVRMQASGVGGRHVPVSFMLLGRRRACCVFLRLGGTCVMVVVCWLCAPRWVCVPFACRFHGPCRSCCALSGVMWLSSSQSVRATLATWLRVSRPAPGGGSSNHAWNAMSHLRQSEVPRAEWQPRRAGVGVSFCTTC